MSVWAWNGSTVLPMVQVYSAAGQLIPSTVVTNENGTFTVQVPNQTAGTTYYLRVSAANPSGSHCTGVYVLGAALAPVAPAWYDHLTGGKLDDNAKVASSALTVADGKLTQFSLSATTAAGAPDTAVRMTIFDNTGKAVFTMVSVAGQPLATGTVWLSAGTFTVVYNAATRTGAPLQNVSFDVSKRERSDPLDPFMVDTAGNPLGSNTSGGSVITSTPINTTPITTTLIDPISDPFLGL